MKTRHLLLVSVLLFSLAACGLFSVSSPAGEPLTAQALVGTDTIALRPTQAGAEQAATATATPSLIVYLPVVTTPDRWQPPVGATWQWQLDQAVDTSFDVAVYDVDLFDTDPSVVAALHAQGRKVICYLSAGSWEDWRPDADRFPAAVIGKDYGGWPGEKWLDIRQIDLLAPIMRARLDLCRDKGFDAVEPDNIDGYTNDTGFLLTYDDQLAYNTWLAEEAHARGLSIGLKNDGEQVADLLPYFDWALTEDCFFEAWCEDMSPFIEAGKPVFAAEYTDTGIITADFCSQAAALGFSAILKHRDLDAWMEACVSGGTAVSCPIFPANNIWNTPIEALSVHPNSAAYVNTIGASDNLHPDFGAGLWQGAPIGIPYVEVPGSQPKVGVSFTYDDESDPGPYPIPANAPIEGGPNSDGDRHVIVIDRDNCLLYELFYAWPQPDGSWTADSGAIFDLNSNALRPDGWTSADAAGLPILAGLVRYDEVAAGEIRHALRFTAPQTRRDYVWPARHYASSLTGAQYPPMGQRFRLKASYDISGFSPDAQVILQALKTYGMILADNGSPWFLSGAPDDRWDNDVLNELKQVQGLDFEAVDVSSLMVDPDSAQVRNSTTPTPTPTPTATRPASECVSDVNSNGIGDVVDILATAAEPGCVVYLPLVIARWRQPWEIATPAPTGTPTVTPTATSSASPTATPTPTPTSTSTPTATATTPSAGSPTVTPTPTATGTAITADLFVDDGNTTGTEDGAAQYPYNTVQEAINAASDGDAIAVAAGTYAENIRVQDKAVHLYGGYVGGAAADYAGGAGGDFSARNPTANTTHIQGDGTDSTVTLREAGASTVDGFRITGGSRSVEGLPWYNLGGGVYVGGGSPTIAHNIIENNDTRNAASPENENTGGGVYTTDAEVSILDNLIRNNISGRGAGIAIEGGSVIIRGNTVQGNAGVSDHGGGLYITSPSADISHNVIRGNEVGRALGYGWGGGITLFGVGSSATLAYNVITDNYAPSMGSGLFIDDGATATLDHELIYGNQCTESGGVGIYVDGAGEGDPGDPGSTVNVIHSTVASHNCSTWPGGNGLLIERNSQATVTNSIFWDHGGDDFWVDATSTFSVTYTTSQEAIAGAGNLTAGPLFAAAGSGDYHLQSTAGRWDPSANGGSGGWVVDASHSPAIDAGDPASDHAGEPIPNGGRANMGVYGNTAQASKSNATINRE